MDFLLILQFIGPLSIAVVLMLLAGLSRELSHAENMPPYHRSLYVSAALMFFSTAARLYYGLVPAPHNATNDLLAGIVCLGLPSIALTLGLVVTWRYWSWLLAERG